MKSDTPHKLCSPSHRPTHTHAVSAHRTQAAGTPNDWLPPTSLSGSAPQGIGSPSNHVCARGAAYRTLAYTVSHRWSSTVIEAAPRESIAPPKRSR